MAPTSPASSRRTATTATGVAGVAFGVKILPIKALDCQGSGLMSDVASGVIWAADHGARVINISLGSSAGQATLQDAIRYAVAHNVLVVAAAGNCGVLSSRCTTVNEPQYPGAYPEVLAVAATDENDGHASFSNTGAYVGISAPGVRIFSTTPTYPTTLSRAGSPTSYAAFSGTSQATPMVAGVAALLLSREPSLTPAQLTTRLRGNHLTAGVPILMFSDLREAQDMLAGYAVGADDYLPKPFELAILEAKVQALLRRSAGAASNPNRGRVILFAHAKGGVGTTSLAVNTAVLLAAQSSRPVGLLDLDVEFGDSAVLLERPSEPDSRRPQSTSRDSHR